MTYNVFSGTLNPTQSVNQSITRSVIRARVRIYVCIEQDFVNLALVLNTFKCSVQSIRSATKRSQKAVRRATRTTPTVHVSSPRYAVLHGDGRESFVADEQSATSSICVDAYPLSVRSSETASIDRRSAHAASATRILRRRRH